jgi:hypothetical protein
MLGVGHGLPVAHIPKERHVAAMRNNVVNAFSGEHAAVVLVKVINCKRVRLQERF